VGFDSRAVLSIAQPVIMPCTDVAAEQEASIDLCRVCWETSDDRDGGCLLSPCSCKGSVQHIHARCLARWQLTCKARGRQGHGLRCDICKDKFAAEPSATSSYTNDALRVFVLHLTGSISQQALPSLVCRAWLGATALSIVATGAAASLSGATQGMLFGARLIDKQLSLVLQHSMLNSRIRPSVILVPAFCCFPFHMQLASFQILATTAVGLLLGSCSGAAAGVLGLLRWHADLGCHVHQKFGTGAIRAAAAVAKGLLRLLPWVR
jgi:hypothetical protein